jgi:hypothetical protein
LAIVDLALKDLDKNWSEDFMESRAIVSQLRMKFVTDIRLLDSIASSIFSEERVNSIGFRPLGLGGSIKEIAKSDNSDLIGRILRGKANVKDITRETKPKARNE